MSSKANILFAEALVKREYVHICIFLDQLSSNVGQNFAQTPTDLEYNVFL